MKWLGFVLSVFITQVSSSQDVPQHLRKQLSIVQDYQKETLHFLENQRLQLKGQRKKALKQDRDRIDKELKIIENQWKSAKEGYLPSQDLLVPADGEPLGRVLRVGKIGALQFPFELTIIQVDGTRVLASFNTSNRAWKAPQEPVLIYGLNTKDLADGQKLQPYTYHVRGTESYDTVAGAKKTVYALEVVQIEELLPFLKLK